MQADFHIKPLEENDEFALAEPLKLSFYQMRYFWLGNAQKFADFALFQVALREKVQYLNPYFASRKKFLSIRQTDVSKYIATAFFKNGFLCHCCFSLATASL